MFGGTDRKGEERVRVDAELNSVVRRDLIENGVDPELSKFWVMNWCITRL